MIRARRDDTKQSVVSSFRRNLKVMLVHACACTMMHTYAQPCISTFASRVIRKKRSKNVVIRRQQWYHPSRPFTPPARIYALLVSERCDMPFSRISFQPSRIMSVYRVSLRINTYQLPNAVSVRIRAAIRPITMYQRGDTTHPRAATPAH